MEECPLDSRLGECWRVRIEESFVGRENDCSNGFGSRSRLLRRGRGGGRLSCAALLAAAAVDAGWESAGGGGWIWSTGGGEDGCEWWLLLCVGER